MNRLTSILGAVAVIAIAFVFVIQFRPASNAAKVDSGPTCAVEVHGGCIPTAWYWASYRLIVASADTNRLKGMNLRRQIADGLVEQWLLNQDAKRLGITISDDELSRELVAGRAHVSVPVDRARQLAYQFGLDPSGRGETLFRALRVKNPKTKKFDQNTYSKAIRDYTKLSPEEFRDFQKAELVAERMRDLVRSRVRVGESEAFEQFSREKSTATLDYVRFDPRFYADVVLDTSPKNVEAWAASHKEELDKIWDARKAQVMPECRVARRILVKVEDTSSDEEKAAAKKKMDAAVERLKKGDDFADVARDVSEDETTAEQGGYLGCLLKGKAPKPLEEAAAALGAGKTSDPIKTEDGLNLLKIEKVAKDADAEKVARADIARELFIKYESDRLATEGAKQVLAAVKGGKSLKDALDAYMSELKQKAGAGKDEKKKDEKKDDKAKKDEKKKDEKKGRAAPTIDNHPARPVVETTLPFNATGEPIQGAKPGADVAKIAFGLEKPGDAPGDLVPLQNGFAVIQLKEKTPASKEQWDKDREFYLSAMRAAKQQDALSAYVKRLHGKLATEVKYSSVTQEPKESKEPGPDEPTAPVPIGDDGE